jgi:hypothetical protein
VPCDYPQREIGDQQTYFHELNSLLAARDLPVASLSPRDGRGCHFPAVVPDTATNLKRCPAGIPSWPQPFARGLRPPHPTSRDTAGQERQETFPLVTFDHQGATRLAVVYVVEQELTLVSLDLAVTYLASFLGPILRLEGSCSQLRRSILVSGSALILSGYDYLV